VDDLAESSQALLADAEGSLDLITQIEEMIILGHGKAQIYLWAIDNGLQTSQVDKLVSIVRQLRKISADPNVNIERREEQRDRYLRLFRLACTGDKLDLALKILEQLSKFDGMILPEVSINMNSTTITSQTRQRATELMDRVRSLSTRPAGRKIVDLPGGTQLLASEGESAPARADHKVARSDDDESGNGVPHRVKDDPRNPKDDE